MFLGVTITKDNKHNPTHLGLHRQGQIDRTQPPTLLSLPTHLALHRQGQIDEKAARVVLQGGEGEGARLEGALGLEPDLAVAVHFRHHLFFVFFWGGRLLGWGGEGEKTLWEGAGWGEKAVEVGGASGMVRPKKLNTLMFFFFI